jgi:hypothetical protein
MLVTTFRFTPTFSRGSPSIGAVLLIPTIAPVATLVELQRIDSTGLTANLNELDTIGLVTARV